jgi:hypothetical protein
MEFDISIYHRFSTVWKAFGGVNSLAKINKNEDN